MQLTHYLISFNQFQNTYTKCWNGISGEFLTSFRIKNRVYFIFNMVIETKQISLIMMFICISDTLDLKTKKNRLNVMIQLLASLIMFMMFITSYVIQEKDLTPTNPRLIPYLCISYDNNYMST